MNDERELKRSKRDGRVPTVKNTLRDAKTERL